MTDSLADLLGQPGPGSGTMFGLVTGIVTNNQDPDGLGRIRVRFPWLADEAESAWARVAAPMSGPKRGVFFLPEVDDEVLVAFQHGRVDAPVVLGSLWNKVSKPPADNADGKNDMRLIVSRSGHVVRFDDTDGKEKIEIIDKTGKNTIVVDAANNKIIVQAEADITITSSNGKVALSGKEVSIAATGGDVAIEAKAAMTLKAGADMTVKGQTINLN